MGKKFKVSDACVGCQACVGVAGDNFEMNNEGKAYVKTQPKSDAEVAACEEAVSVCPVGAISMENDDEDGDSRSEDDQKKPILAKSNIKETLDKYPDLKSVLINLSPKFKKMSNPILYNTLARFATFSDAAKMTGKSICEILHVVNEFLGTINKLEKIMPECIASNEDKTIFEGESLTWKETDERLIYNFSTMDEIYEKLENLSEGENIVIISPEKPSELIKVVKGLGYKFNVEVGKDYRISVFNPAASKKIERDVLDVRGMSTDPFDIIMKKAYKVEAGEGFLLVQNFKPTPMINMLTEMGFKANVEKELPGDVEIFFYREEKNNNKTYSNKEKPEVVIQSATPVAYPVILKLLQSERIRDAITIKELKVWEETEKHLGWIVNGKADISFSALLTYAKMKDAGVKIPALFVWDNFSILTSYEAKTLSDLKGKTISTPLFEGAPPAKITQYLIKASGLDVDDFTFSYGEPFGRPEQIFADFVSGKADTVILREPEASFAIKAMEEAGKKVSVISYNKLWNDVNPGYGSFPNAGLVVKEEFLKKYPEEAEIFLEELKKSILWVVENKRKAAEMAYDIMRQPVPRVEFFLENVNFNYVDGEELVSKVAKYFEILNSANVTNVELNETFLNMFRV